MSYTPPAAEQKFLLKHVVRLEAAGHNLFAEATPYLCDAIVAAPGLRPGVRADDRAVDQSLRAGRKAR